MFISVLELFKIGIGPSSSHTMGPMVAAKDFITLAKSYIQKQPNIGQTSIRCLLKNSLAHTGKGHHTDRAVALGMHGFLPEYIINTDISALIKRILNNKSIQLDNGSNILFNPVDDIIFDKKDSLSQHPNGMVFELLTLSKKVIFSQTYFSIGGGFIITLDNFHKLNAPLISKSNKIPIYAFNSAKTMLEMSAKSGLTIAQMKRINEVENTSVKTLERGLDTIWSSMQHCVQKGLKGEGILPGGLGVQRRAKNLYQQLKQNPDNADVNDWLCAYAMAVNEENAMGNMVVTAPTNGAAGVIPAILYYLKHHKCATTKQIHDFLLTASAIGGLIKHQSSISGAEVGCQGEVGTASAMAAAGLCALNGGTTLQIENAAEIALEQHLGLTCDPVDGLVQVPCIERNGFGAIKAYLAASIALKESGKHIISLDRCIIAMKKTGLDMSVKYKETSLGGLALSMIEC